MEFNSDNWLNKIRQLRSWGPICSFTSMITDWIGQDIVLFPKLFENENTKLSNNFSLEVKKKIQVRARWHVLSNYLGKTHTALLQFPINVEIRAADSQSD